MPEKRNFALRVWEKTPEFEKECRETREKFEQIMRRLHNRDFTCSVDSMQPDANGDHQFWSNDYMGNYKDLNSEEAERIARKYGKSGWWSLSELEQFANNDGPILSEAMWHLGFRRSKTKSSKWSKLEPKLKGTSNPDYLKAWERHNGKVFTTILRDEADRIKELLVLPYGNAGVGKTYGLQAGTRGMIYAQLWANPFAGHSHETMHVIGQQLANKGHIAIQQEGFRIEANNVKVFAGVGGIIGEGIPVDAVYVKAVRPDNSYAECLWPSAIPCEKLWDLADDLVARAKGDKTGPNLSL